MKPASLKYLQHILCWTGLYLFWILVFQKRSFAFSQTATIEFCYLLFIGANFYFNVYFTIPRLLYKQRYAAFTLLFLAGILLTSIFRVPLAQYMNAHVFSVASPPAAMRLFINSFLNISIWTAAIIAGKILTDRLRVQQYVEKIQQEKLKAELDFLNAQMNPHFLFNSLHSIYGHIDKNNGTARNMLLTFSDMLRYQLYDCNNSSIGLDKELNYIKNYVALQRSRKEEDLLVNMQVNNSIRGLSVSPLLFICFVENAFKYVGSNERGENRIDISFTSESNRLVFKCLNTLDPIPVQNTEHKGIGISNAKRRLALHYPGKHDLDIHENGEYYVVKLTIELNETEMHHS